MTNDQLQPQEIEEPKLFTQRELEEIIAKRLFRERKKIAKLIQPLSEYLQLLSEEVK